LLAKGIREQARSYSEQAKKNFEKELI
jgi:hypothetical protein